MYHPGLFLSCFLEKGQLITIHIYTIWYIFSGGVEMIDKAIGMYHFITDRAPRNIPIVEPKPRLTNRFCQNNRPLVSKVAPGSNLRESIEKCLTLLGDAKKIFRRGDRILVKPNFNSPDPFPASTDLYFMRAILDILTETGSKITIGESSGGIWRPTRKVFRKMGVTELARECGVELIAFDDKNVDWVNVRINGAYLDSIIIPRLVYEADTVLYLPCMKTHNIAGYTGALKLAVGFMHPGERRALHARYLKQKIAEVNLFRQPDLIIMDGRKAFVSGGPDRGQLVNPSVLLASEDPVAIDVEAMHILLAYEARNKIMPDPWQSAEIVTALQHRLSTSQDGYELLK